MVCLQTKKEDMKYRIIKVNYGPPDCLKAPMYIAMYKEHWWNMWKGFKPLTKHTTSDIFFVEKFCSPEEALDSLRLRLREINVKYPQFELLEQGKL
jgi:hypothetical protein